MTPYALADADTDRPEYAVDYDGTAAALRREARRIQRDEPLLAGLAGRLLQDQPSFAHMLAAMLAHKIADRDVGEDALAELCHEAFAQQPEIVDAAKNDLMASYDRNPAATSLLIAFLYFKGYQALQWYRVAAAHWRHGRGDIALWIQSRVSEALQVDIHPAAEIGVGVFIDHATGVVIGETAKVGNNVSILQQVTLGGTGKEAGDRHPKVADGVLLGAGARVLGNIRIGRCSKIGAGSVVLQEVPDFCTAAGVPASIVRAHADCSPGLEMDQEFSI